MNIEFEKIEVQNFKSIGEMITFDYREYQGLNFVYGKNLDVPNAKNGSGKTNLLIDALMFALFGKTLKNTNNKYLPNRFVSEKLKPYAKLYFRSNGQLYSCETYGRVVGGVMSTIGMELLKLDNDYNVIEDLTQSSVNKTKQYIQNNLLGCTFNVFKSSVIISSSDFINFYEGLNKDQKRKYIENIFNLDCFGEMFKLIKSDINETKREISSTKNEILNNASSLEDLNKKFAEYDEKISSGRDELKEKILAKYKELKSLEKKLEKLNKNDTSSLESLKEEKTLISNEINELTLKKSKLDKINIRKDAEISNINKMIDELENISKGLCKDCVKIMNERYNYEEKQNDIVSAQEIIKDNEEKIKEIKALILEKTEFLDDLKSKIEYSRSIEAERNKLTIALEYSTREIKNLKISYEDIQKKSNNPFEELINKTKDTLKSLKRRLIEFNNNMLHLEVLRDACSENGVKRFIIKDIIKLLNSLIQKYLNEIGCDFLVYFDEAMDFTFLTQSGECEFSNFSAGEKQRIQISTMLAFRDLILNGKLHSNIFIIDEMLDMNVDSICIENVMKILKRKSIESNQNIFIVSHRSELAEDETIWNNIIKITKEHGQSTYSVK
jgi:DNA repair exonuclease SbcCD ATPase subunit